MSTEALFLVYLLSKESVVLGGYLLDVNALKTTLPSLLNDGIAIEKNYSGDGGRVRGVVIALDNMGILLKRMANGTS